jgi:hypothetical protein
VPKFKRKFLRQRVKVMSLCEARWLSTPVECVDENEESYVVSAECLVEGGKEKYFLAYVLVVSAGTDSGAVVEALRYKPEGRRFEFGIFH